MPEMSSGVRRQATHNKRSKNEGKKIRPITTPMKHDLKTWTEYFQAVKSGDKTFEIRENDRNFKVGDVLLLREFIPCPECSGTRRTWKWSDKDGDSVRCECAKCADMPEAGIYTGEEIEKTVSYMTDFGQKDFYVVMALA